ITTPFSHGWMFIGSRLSGYPQAELEATATSGNISLKFFGNGVENKSWDDLNRLQITKGAFGILFFHGSWNEAEQRHQLTLGEGHDVPTTEITRCLYEKGVREMTFFACQIG